MGDLIKAIRSLTNAIQSLERGGYHGSARKLKLERAALERLVNN